MKPASATTASLLAIRPSGGAGAILIDAPLRFETRSPKGEARSPQHHYSCLSIDEIAALPVADIAAPNCFLFSWIPLRSVDLVKPLMKAWGFQFSGTAFAWAKLNPSGVGWAMGGGYGTRKNVEICWLGRRGSPRRNSAAVRELIVAPRREHSRKPDEVYGRIETFCDGPYVELFARQRGPGWIAWGDQTDWFDQEYDPIDDLAKSVAEGFRAIRERKAVGGPGWIAGGDTSHIPIRRGSQVDEWLTIHPNGRIEHHLENDGPQFVRHGAQARDEWIDLEHVKNYWPEVLPQVEAVLAALPDSEEQ